MLQEPSEKIKKEIYQFYTKIYDSSFDLQKKKNLLTSIAGWEKWLRLESEKANGR